MKTVFQNLKGHTKEIILGPLFKLFEAVLELMVPLIMAKIIDVGIPSGDKAYIMRMSLLLLAIAALGMGAAMICQYYAAVVGGHFGKSLRTQVYRHVMNLSAKETEQYGSGGLIIRLTNDIAQIQNGVNMAIRLASRVPFLALGSIIMALILNWRIGLIFVITTPLIAWILYAVMRSTIPRYGEIQSGQDRLSGLAGENLSGTRVIRAFSKQKAEREGFAKAGNDLSIQMMRVGKISALLNPLTSVAVHTAIIFIIWLGAGFAFYGESEPGQIIALVSYMNQTFLALVVAANLIVIFTRAAASIKRVDEVLKMQSSIIDGQGAVENREAAAVCLRNVRFAYHKGAENALHDINLEIQRGQTVGIIGGTGSGKSTLANLILRVYDADNGQIEINGADIRTYTLQSLRNKIGFVPQYAALFTGTIRYNLQIGNPEADDETLWNALRIAQAAEFVENLPDGLDAVLYDGGKNLSGGQRQRLTIARAIVRKPEILTLDDAASALDYATNARLQKAIRTELSDITTIIISQRVSAISHADFILVLDDGHTSGLGTHDELLEHSELYREICESQNLYKRGGA